MLAEHPRSTTKRFIPSWRTVDDKSLGEQIKSVFNETNRIPDPASFIVNNRELIDPATNKAFDFTRNTPIEIAEGKVWDDLKKWANESFCGKAVWISPLLDTVYPTNKICFYEINYTQDFPPQKIIQSTTILFDTTKDYCLKIAQKINPLFANTQDPEFLRSQLLKLRKDQSLVDILEMIPQTEKEQKQTPSQETINYFVGEIKSGRDAASIVKEMQSRGIIGEFSISCPTAGSRVLLNNSRILDFTKKHDWEWTNGDCVRCGEKNTKIGPCKVCRKCNDEIDMQELANAA